MNARSALGRSLALLAIGVTFSVLAALQTGCSNGKLAPTREPVLAQCDAVCYAPCVKPDGDTGRRWSGVKGHDPDPPIAKDPAAWDALAEITLGLADELRVCDARRDACVRCLNRLEQQKVIVQ